MKAGRRTIMSIDLTEEQQRAVMNGQPVTITTPELEDAVVLVRASVFARYQELLDEDTAIKEMYPHIWDVMKEDWNDPAMSVYDQLSSTEKP
jgi:hypothetical protein